MQEGNRLANRWLRDMGVGSMGQGGELLKDLSRVTGGRVLIVNDLYGLLCDWILPVFFVKKIKI